MKNKLLSLALMVSLLSGQMLVNADGGADKLNKLSSQQRGIIINNYKKLQNEMLFEQDFGINPEDYSILKKAEKVRIYEIIKNKISQKKNSLEKEGEKIADKVLTLKETLSGIDDLVEDSQRKIDSLSVETAWLVKSIKDNRIKALNIEKKIQNNKEALAEYLTQLYKTQNIVYSENEIDNLRVILMSGGSLGEIMEDYNFRAIMQVAGEKMIEKHRKYMTDLYISKSELSKKINESRRKKVELQSLTKKLETKRILKEKLLKITKGREDLYKKYIKEKTEAEKNSKLKYLKEKVSLAKLQEKVAVKYGCDNLIDSSNDDTSDRCLSIGKVIMSESKLTASDASEIKLLWPVNPKRGLSAYFGDSSYYKTFGASHDAIDIRVKQGTNLRAASDGYVVYVQEPKEDVYSYVAIKHANNLITVYGHLSEVNVKQYDFVTAGQIFGKTGGEPGTPGAGIMTTGAHFHFEVLQDEKPKDPLNYLDLTALRLEDIPQSKYVYKYYDDFKAKYGDEKEFPEDALVFKLEGDDEISKQKYMLSKYGAKGFKDWNVWVEEAVDGNIDPTFMMCIALAETGIGRNVKTENNVGNIGNTDSGATKTYPTPRSGIYWMARTLNNKYLGQYEHINELSRYGNKTGPIYASSPDHWNNNIVKCMSEIKGKYVPDDYKFRISNETASFYKEKIIASK